MSRFFWMAVAAAMLVVPSGALAATQRQVDAAVEKGTNFLKARFKGGVPANTDGHGIGPTALAGIALLEAKVPANDPAIQAIAKAVREASYTEVKSVIQSLQ